jgi:hypothetical protein
MDSSAIERTLKDYAEAWRQNQAAALPAFWDAARFAFYKAEEVSRFFTAFDEAFAYWQQNEGLHDAIRLRLGDIQVVPLADGLAMAMFEMAWDIRFAAQARLANGQDFHHRGKAMGGFNHVLAMLRHSDAGWKLIGWSETPDAAITYMTQLYYRTAAADFQPG